MRGRKISRRALITAISGGIVSACTSASDPGPTFEDDFSGLAGSPPDPARWRYDTGDSGYGYGQLQTYTSSRANSFLDGHGHLVIRATRRGDGYASARLTTLGRFTQYRGTFEARIKLPVQAGLWPAFWLLGMGRWPSHGEVDIMENYGQDFAESSVHTPDGPDRVFTASRRISVDGAWHTWRTEWDAHGFSFSRDGLRYLTVKPSELRDWPFGSGSPMYLILNLAIGGAADAPPPGTKFPAEMLVDYVRAWK